jgi:hypothetical protein
MEWVSPDLLGNAWLMHATAKDYIAMPTGAASRRRVASPPSPPKLARDWSPKQNDWATRRKCFWIQKYDAFTMKPIEHFNKVKIVQL